MPSGVTTLTVPNGYTIANAEGDKSSLTFNNHGDVILTNPARKSSGRALVVGGNDTLIINYAGDFTGGVYIKGITTPPSGVATDYVRIDADGKLYKAD